MADPRVFQLDEILNRPGTYFNPQTEVLVVVDDSPELDSEIFNMEELEGADWVLFSDDTPFNENARNNRLEAFQSRYHPGAATPIRDDADEHPDETEETDQKVGREKGLGWDKA